MSTTPESGVALRGGREGAWIEPGTKRLNRLRVKVAAALLRDQKPGSPVGDAAAFLHRVIAGTESASVETKTQAASAMLRAAVALSAKADGPSSSVTIHGPVQVNAHALTPEAVRAASDLLAALGGDQPGGAPVEPD